MGETRLQRDIRMRDIEVRRAIGRSVRDLREDAALTRAAVAESAGIDASFLGRIETGSREPSLSTLNAIATVLGADLSVRLFPTTGPRIRDRIQAPMVESLVRTMHARWTSMLEVVVQRPARGVIDLVLADPPTPLLVASEVHSELRRVEQQIRWHREKELSLPSSAAWHAATWASEPTTSRLLVLRSTRDLRELAVTFEATLHAAYPARTRDVLDAFTGASAPWPGAGIVWMRVEAGRAELIDGPPRGVRLGR
jgi:transcriptional regulator with XRE-family HTH domain